MPNISFPTPDSPAPTTQVQLPSGTQGTISGNLQTAANALGFVAENINTLLLADGSGNAFPPTPAMTALVPVLAQLQPLLLAFVAEFEGIGV